MARVQNPKQVEEPKPVEKVTTLSPQQFAVFCIVDVPSEVSAVC